MAKSQLLEHSASRCLLQLALAEPALVSHVHLWRHELLEQLRGAPTAPG